MRLCGLAGDTHICTEAGCGYVQRNEGVTLLKIAKTARLARLEERRWMSVRAVRRYTGEMEYSLWTDIDSETLREAASDTWPRYRVLSLSNCTLYSVHR